MIPVTELRKNVTFEWDGQLWRVIEYDHYKPGRGNALIRTKLRNLRTGGTLDKNFLSGERVQDIRLDHHTVSYLYNDGDLYYFMDTETFEQPALDKDSLGDAVHYLKEGVTLELSLYEGKPIDVDLPVTVDMVVADAPMAIAGDTATGATKFVTTETGLKVTVPLFVKEGETIRVDTRTGQYLTRV
jgi:elongation factor P